jgi:hypothetical protein
MYRAAILPHDRSIMQAFDYSLVDLHSAGTLRLYPVLIQEPRLSALSVTLDRHPSGPSITELIPSFKAILESKSLVVFGDVTREELDILLKLPPRGLCVNVRVTG